MHDSQSLSCWSLQQNTENKLHFMVSKPYVFSYLHSLFFNPALPELCELYIGLSYITYYWRDCQCFKHLLPDYFNGNASDRLPLKVVLLNSKSWTLFSPSLHTWTLRFEEIKQHVQVHAFRKWLSGKVNRGLAPLCSLHVFQKWVLQPPVPSNVLSPNYSSYFCYISRIRGDKGVCIGHDYSL